MYTKIRPKRPATGGSPAVTVPTADRLAFSISEAAKLTSLSRSALYLAIQAGRLRRIKRGRRALILREDLLHFLNDEAST
jgi:excisionase family DNA binding protein